MEYDIFAVVAVGQNATPADVEVVNDVAPGSKDTRARVRLLTQAFTFGALMRVSMLVGDSLEISLGDARWYDCLCDDFQSLGAYCGGVVASSLQPGCGVDRSKPKNDGGSRAVAKKV